MRSLWSALYLSRTFSSLVSENYFVIRTVICNSHGLFHSKIGDFFAGSQFMVGFDEQMAGPGSMNKCPKRHEEGHSAGVWQLSFSGNVLACIEKMLIIIFWSHF